MSDAVFYRSALARELGPEERALFQSLFARAEQMDALALALPDQILANRTRREGKPAALSKAAKRTIRSFTKDSQQAAAELPALVAGIRTAVLIRAALESERTALSLDQAVYTGGHDDDNALARPLLELRAQNIAELETFLAGTKTKALEP